jgi:hypothetical protein
MLSEQDRVALAEIERGLAADHPDLPRVMARRRRWPHVRVMLVALLALVWTAATIAAAAWSWPAAIVPAALEVLVMIAFLVHRLRRRSTRA